MNNLQPSDAILHFIMSPDMENVKLVAYPDSRGIWTIGVGHTLGVQEGDTCTYAQAMEWFREDSAPITSVVNQLLTDPDQNGFDAFFSAGFNMGVGDLRQMSAVALYNAGSKTTAAQHFLLWDEVAGKPSEGILKRRKCEAIILLGQPWQISTFANDADPYTNAETLTRCVTAYQ
jgi:lysozyme